MSEKRYLFMMFGHVGAGKSHVAEWLAPHIGAVHLRVDDMRVEMFDGDRPDLYTPEMKALVNNAHTYSCRQVLRSGLASVVADANHNQRRVRQKMEDLARSVGAVPVVIWVQTPEAVAKGRIQSRAESGGHVIFDPNIIENMKKTTDLPGPDEPIITIDGLASAEEQRATFDEQFAALAKNTLQ